MIVAVALLGVVAGRSSATSLQIDNSTSGFRATFGTFFASAGGFQLECAVTLSGQFVTRTFAKTAGSTIATMSSMNVAACEGGTLVLLGGPRIRYLQFSGTLPAITSLTVEMTLSFSIRILGSTCLTTAPSLTATAILNAAQRWSQMRFDESQEIPFTGLCAPVEPAHLWGTGSVTVLEEASFKPEFRLI